MSNIQVPKLLVLVRHGESLLQTAKDGQPYLPSEAAAEIIRPRPDHEIPLTELGKQQALQTGEWLRQRFGVFDAVYHSGYTRTIETTSALVHAYPPEELTQMRFYESYLIREREIGYTYRMTAEEVAKHFPWYSGHVETFGEFYSRPPGGQSQADLCDQVARFLDELNRFQAGRKVLLVTHGGTIRALRFNLEHWTASGYVQSLHDRPRNAGVTVYQANSAGTKLELERSNFVPRA